MKNNVWLYWVYKRNYMNNKINNHLQKFLKKYVTIEWVKEQLFYGVDITTLTIILAEIFLQLYLPSQRKKIKITNEVRRDIRDLIYDWIKIKTIKKIRELFMEDYIKNGESNIIKLRLRQLLGDYLTIVHLN